MHLFYFICGCGPLGLPIGSLLYIYLSGNPQIDWLSADYTIIIFDGALLLGNALSLGLVQYAQGMLITDEGGRLVLEVLNLFCQNTHNFRLERRIVVLHYIFFAELPGSNPPEWTAHLILPPFILCGLD